VFGKICFFILMRVEVENSAGKAVKKRAEVPKHAGCSTLSFALSC
jgi:hypothetical protein